MVVLSEQGADRRQRILDATVRVLASDGLGAVSHRVIAREAETPLAATTYYFESKDDLLREALELMAAAEIKRLRARAAELAESVGSAEELANAIAEFFVPRVDDERDAMLAKYELYLEAARRPALRATARRWIEAFTALAKSVLEQVGIPDPEERAELLVAALDGTVVHQLATARRRGARERMRSSVRYLTGTLLRP